jgi:hypothetical protein
VASGCRLRLLHLLATGAPEGAELSWPDQRCRVEDAPSFAGQTRVEGAGRVLGRFRPLQDQRSQEPALLGFRFEPDTRGEFRTCRAEIVAPAVDAIAICGSHEVNRTSVRRVSSCDPNVCGMRRTRIVAGLSRPSLLRQ